MTESDDPQDDDPAAHIEATNVVLSEWASRSAADSDALIERFEAMGYTVRGKSAEEIADILRRPPTRTVR